VIVIISGVSAFFLLLAGLLYSVSQKRRTHNALLLEYRKQKSEYEVFLSYRVNSDADMAERFYDKLTARGIRVWWDKKCLPQGLSWEDGFADGLFACKVFVPILSTQALEPFSRLNTSSRCDNFFLEQRMALPLEDAGDLRAICPILVGKVEEYDAFGEMYGDFFADVPSCPDAVVASVESKASEHFARVSKVLDAPRTVSQVLGSILNHQGVKLVGIKSQALEKAVEGVVSALESQRLSLSSSKSSRGRSDSPSGSSRPQPTASCRFHFTPKSSQSSNVSALVKTLSAEASVQDQPVRACTRSSSLWAVLRQKSNRIRAVPRPQEQLFRLAEAPPPQIKNETNATAI